MPRAIFTDLVRVSVAIGLAAATASCFNEPSTTHACDSCDPCEQCVDGPLGPTCAATSHAGTGCGQGPAVYWVDSCGTVEDEVSPCPSGRGECVASGNLTAVCSCLEHWTGDDCSTCPANWDPAQSCAECSGNWIDESNNCGTCPGNWDPAQDCATCVGNWDESTGCTTCLNHWIDEGDDCGTCPGNWDPAQDCAVCANAWTGADCETCPGNWDPAADCGDCLGNWDPTADCAECAGNWDPSTDCETCLPDWFGSECTIGRRLADVESEATSPDGMTWATAFPRLQDAVDDCADVVNYSSASACEVWVAQGVYYLFETSRSNTLVLQNDVEVYGGFDGTETSLGERDWATNQTVLDGLEAEGSLNVVYHVVTGADGAILDGFTVRNGVADGEYGSPEENGGGMLNAGASPVVRNCSFVDNYASHGGGAIINSDSSASFENCEFDDNYAYDLGGAVYGSASAVDFIRCQFHGNSSDDGGAVYIEGGSALIDGCLFTENSSGGYGGAVYNDASNCIVASSEFLNNSTYYYGGAIYNYNGVPIVRDSVFGWNEASTTYSAYSRGGGIFDHSSDAHILNSTFYQNSADDGGSAIYNWDSDALIANCIVWVCTLGALDSSPEITYCDVQAGSPGVGNFSSDPLFVDPISGDFRLQAGSPCIDAADGDHAPNLDKDGEARFDDPDTPNTGVNDPPYADVGAYEFLGD